MRGRLSDECACSGDDVVCDGALGHGGLLRLRCAHRCGRGAHGSELCSRLVELQSVPAIRVEMQGVVRGDNGIGTPLRVLGPNTSGPIIYRSGARQTRFDFTVFAVDQREPRE